MNSANRNISLRAIRVFCAAAECESFREAAEQLFLTSSAVSHQIRHLETELGVKLFERTPRSLQLTSDGAALNDEMRPLVAEFDAAIARHARAQRPRSLRISVQPFFASELFVPRLADFVERHPDIDISIDTSDESPEKHPGTADVSIRIFKAAPSGFACDPLFRLRLIPAGTLELYDSVKVRAGRIVSRFPLVVHTSRQRAWHDWERASRIRLPNHKNTIQLDSMIAVARAAERGLGAALIPKQLSHAWFESGRLVQLFDQELLTKDTYYLVYRKQDHKNPEIEAFRRWVLQKFVDER